MHFLVGWEPDTSTVARTGPPHIRVVTERPLVLVALDSGVRRSRYRWRRTVQHKLTVEERLAPPAEEGE